MFKSFILALKSNGLIKKLNHTILTPITTLLQRVGKALMTPIAVLPIAALLLRLGYGDIPFLDGEIALVMKHAGESIFTNLDLLFGIGIAYGLAKNNDGSAALAGAIGVLIAKSVYMSINKDINMGVFIGIIMGILAGHLYNKYHTITLPDFLGFFGGKRLIPILTALYAIAIGLLAGYFWHYVQAAIDSFSHTIIHLNEIGTFIYGTLNRLFIPIGLHHVLNSIFWFQLGEYSYIKEGVEVVANGDLHRFFAGDKTAGTYMSGFYVVMMFGLPAMAYAIYLNTVKIARKRVGAILFGVAFTSFLTGITEPLEFMFLFVAPLLFLMHALLTGLALALAQLLDIHIGFGFSAGFIDYLINYKLGSNAILILPLGIFFAFVYFTLSYYLIQFLNLKIFPEDKEEAKEKQTTMSLATSYIKALGGYENITQTDACITRLRMGVKDSHALDDNIFFILGAKGVIRPNKSTIHIVVGPKAESIAEMIQNAIKEEEKSIKNSSK